MTTLSDPLLEDSEVNNSSILSTSTNTTNTNELADDVNTSTSSAVEDQDGKKVYTFSKNSGQTPETKVPVKSKGQWIGSQI
jgi:hypothetical protein